MASGKDEILIVATAAARPGMEADLERALRAVAAPTRAQRGCLQFELYRSGQDGASIMALERWASSEDHDRHLQGAHVKALLDALGPIVAGPPSIAQFSPL
jgi:quinol monooxygenase YgiN